VIPPGGPSGRGRRAVPLPPVWLAALLLLVAGLAGVAFAFLSSAARTDSTSATSSALQTTRTPGTTATRPSAPRRVRVLPPRRERRRRPPLPWCRPPPHHRLHLRLRLTPPTIGADNRHHSGHDGHDTNAASTTTSASVISIVIPAAQRGALRRPAVRELQAALEPLAKSGRPSLSTTARSIGSFAALTRLHDGNENVRVVRLRRNFGKASGSGGRVRAWPGRDVGHDRRRSQD
jgi:hypothetical protein